MGEFGPEDFDGASTDVFPKHRHNGGGWEPAPVILPVREPDVSWVRERWSAYFRDLAVALLALALAADATAWLLETFRLGWWAH